MINLILHLKVHVFLFSNIKIIDFGNSFSVGKCITHTNYIVTRYYRAPEICFSCSYNEQLDIWSLGCIFYEILIGKPLFVSKNQRDLVFKICEYIGLPDPSYSNTHFDYYFDHIEPNQISKDINFSEEIQNEDIDICERIQAGLESNGFGSGILSTEFEIGVNHFQNYIENKINNG